MGATAKSLRLDMSSGVPQMVGTLSHLQQMCQSVQPKWLRHGSIDRRGVGEGHDARCTIRGHMCLIIHPLPPEKRDAQYLGIRRGAPKTCTQLFQWHHHITGASNASIIIKKKK